MGLRLPAERLALQHHAPFTHTKQIKLIKWSWQGDLNSKWGPDLQELLDNSEQQRHLNNRLQKVQFLVSSQDIDLKVKKKKKKIRGMLKT